MRIHFFTAPFYFAFIWFRVQGSGFRVSLWGAPSFDYMRKRFSGFKGGGAAHKKIEAPRSIDGGDARRRYSSHQSPVTSRSRLLIPSH